jgi:tetratricopeptide (TPR) repeat protein
MQKNEDAQAAFQRVVEIDPEGAKGYFNLAVQLESVGQAQAALAAFQRFIGLSVDQGLEQQRQYAAKAVERLGN